MSDQPPKPAESDAGVSPAAPAPKLHGWLDKLKPFKTAIVAVAGVGAVLSGLVGYYTTYKAVSGPPTSAEATGAVANADALRIMVLPLANLTGDAAQSYVADALTESITSDLSRIQDALIVPSATVRPYKDKPLPQIAKEIGVRYVLQGNVQRTGTTLRVSATLADAFKNTQLWSQSFEGDTTDLFALQDQITTRIGNSVSMQVVIAAARESETHKNSPKAADLMLRARALGQKPQSRENWLAVEALYRQVLKVEPDNMSAMEGLAEALALRVNNYLDLTSPATEEASFEEARSLALKLREQSATNGVALKILSFYASKHDDLPAATAFQEQLIQLFPKNTAVLNNRGLAHFFDGEGEKALARFEAANALSAVRDGDLYLINAGRAHFMLGHDAQAITLFEQSINKNPAQVKFIAFVAMAYARLGRMDKVDKARDTLLKTNPLIKLSNFDAPQISSTDAYKQWHATQFVSAWRKAGLPE